MHDVKPEGHYLKIINSLTKYFITFSFLLSCQSAWTSLLSVSIHGAHGNGICDRRGLALTSVWTSSVLSRTGRSWPFKTAQHRESPSPSWRPAVLFTDSSTIDSHQNLKMYWSLLILSPLSLARPYRCWCFPSCTALISVVFLPFENTLEWFVGQYPFQVIASLNILKKLFV